MWRHPILQGNGMAHFRQNRRTNGQVSLAGLLGCSFWWSVTRCLWNILGDIQDCWRERPATNPYDDIGCNGTIVGCGVLCFHWDVVVNPNGKRASGWKTAAVISFQKLLCKEQGMVHLATWCNSSGRWQPWSHYLSCWANVFTLRRVRAASGHFSQRETGKSRLVNWFMEWCTSHIKAQPGLPGM